jgi:hypothetical protein
VCVCLREREREKKKKKKKKKQKKGERELHLLRLQPALHPALKSLGRSGVLLRGVPRLLPRLVRLGLLLPVICVCVCVCVCVHLGTCVGDTFAGECVCVLCVCARASSEYVSDCS